MCDMIYIHLHKFITVTLKVTPAKDSELHTNGILGMITKIQLGTRVR